MRITRKQSGIVALGLGVALIAGACAGGAGAAQVGTTGQADQALESGAVQGQEDINAVNALADLDELVAQFPAAVVNDNPILPGGILRRSIVTESAITGIMLPTHSTNATDSDLWGMTMTSMFSTNADLTVGQEGVATFEPNVAERTITITMRDGVQVYWHDGVEMTLDDLLFAYEIISHPDYTGIRWNGSGVNFIEGAAEFRAGEADTISGAVLSEDGRQLVLHMTELPPNLSFGGGLWSTPVARHHWDGVAMADMIDHPNARTNHLGNGPFIIDNIVTGESYSFVANEDYWQGRPNVDGIVIETVSSSIAPIAMQEGQFDMMSFSSGDVMDHGHLNNIQILGQLNQSGSFHTFRLGYMNTDDEGNVTFTPRGDRYDNPIQDPLVRHAIGHSLDQLSIAMTLGGGLTRPATSVLWPFNARHWMDPEHVGHAPNNPDLANQLLDEAGLTERDAEGYRLDFNGNPWTLRWGMTGGTDADVFLAIRQQNLRDAGIRMELWQDDFVDWNWAMDQLNADADTDLDVWTSGWSFGWAPNPRGIWGPTNFNMARFSSPEWDEIQDAILSEDAWDPEFLAYWMSRWEQAFYNDAVALPASYQLAFTAVNNRVANWDVTRGTGTGWHEIGLTAETPFAHN